MNLTCSSCGSDHTQKLSAIYSAGTSHGHASSVTSGVTYDSRGGVGSVSATTSTSSTRQSVLADRVAPPNPRSLGAPNGALGCMAIIGAAWLFGAVSMGVADSLWPYVPDPSNPFSGMGGAGMTSHGNFAGWGAAAGVVLVLFLMSRRRAGIARKHAIYNETVYKPALQEWQSKFYCHRCDTVFKPGN